MEDAVTLAMERQNDLTAIAQRAWIILQAEVLKVEVKDNALRLWTIVRAKNIGRSVAQDATLWALVVQGEKKLDRAIEQVRERLESADAFMSPLVPGDEKQHWNQPSWSIAHLELTPETQRAPIFIFAGVRYTVPGDPERKVTERAFSINQGEASNPFGPHGLGNPPDGWLKLEHLAVHPAGQTRAT